RSSPAPDHHSWPGLYEAPAMSSPPYKSPKTRTARPSLVKNTRFFMRLLPLESSNGLACPLRRETMASSARFERRGESDFAGRERSASGLSRTEEVTAVVRTGKEALALSSL